MSSSYDEKIEGVLSDSQLAKSLVPNKFKFTSQQGRLRRQKLLAGAKQLSATRPISEITLADVCEQAGIPRASAYHFFPNVNAIFLALRFLNAGEIVTALQSVEVTSYPTWQGYITVMVEKASEVLQSDPTVARLVYETNTPDFEGNAFGSEMDKQITDMIYENLAKVYQMPEEGKIQTQLLVGYGIINGVFTLSYRTHQKITEVYRKEAIHAVLAYMQTVLPENLAKR